MSKEDDELKQKRTDFSVYKEEMLKSAKKPITIKMWKNYTVWFLNKIKDEYKFNFKNSGGTITVQVKYKKDIDMEILKKYSKMLNEYIEVELNENPLDYHRTGNTFTSVVSGETITLTWEFV